MCKIGVKDEYTSRGVNNYKEDIYNSRSYSFDYRNYDINDIKLDYYLA